MHMYDEVNEVSRHLLHVSTKQVVALSQRAEELSRRQVPRASLLLGDRREQLRQLRENAVVKSATPPSARAPAASASATATAAVVVSTGGAQAVCVLFSY